MERSFTCVSITLNHTYFNIRRDASLQIQDIYDIFLGPN